MTVYTVKFPLEVLKESETFDTITDDNIEEVVKFNLKSTILTCSGERRSDVNFGCCAKTFLFDMARDYFGLRNTIVGQVKRYVPYITLGEVVVSPYNDDERVLYIKIQYKINALNKKDVFELILSA